MSTLPIFIMTIWSMHLNPEHAKIEDICLYSPRKNRGYTFFRLGR